jgi:hypothetical protein
VQSPVIDKIGGSPEVREELTQALAQGRSVTAKVRWVMKPGDRGRNRWIAFTPLVGSHNQIGVWIAILVDEESENEQKQAPPVKFRAPPKQTAPVPRKQSSLAPESDRATDAEVVNGRIDGRIDGRVDSRVDARVDSRTNARVNARPVDASWGRPVELPERPASSRKGSPPASLHPSNTSVPEMEEGYETLEVRLRKKRERDAARLLEKGGVVVKPTYKSLSPYAFMNNDGP